MTAAFELQAAAGPERIATHDAAGSRTYRELAAASRGLAGRLIEGGVAPGEQVAIYGQRSARWVESLLGVLESGAAFVVLDPEHPPLHSARCLRKARPRALIELGEGSSLPPELSRELDRLEPCLHLALPPGDAPAQATQRVELPAPAIRPDYRAYVAFTSGTTGAPKGVVTPHGPPAHFLEWARATFDFTPADRFGMLSGLAHDPILRDVLLPLSIGASLQIPSAVDLLWPDRLAEWLLRRQVTVLHLTPAMARFLTSGPAPSHPLPLRWAFFAGDVLREREVAALEAVAPRVRCVNYYGATETPQATSFFVVPPAGERRTADPGSPLPIGTGIDEVELLILDPQKAPAKDGEEGEIWVRTTHLASGYLDDPELTRDRFLADPLSGDPRDRVYRTGDLGRRLESGAVLLVGRLDRQVNIRGYRVELAEIESLLRLHPGIDDAAVLALADGQGDPELAAWLCARDPVPGATELRRYLGTRLPSPCVPSSYAHLPRLPLTPSGKLDRQALERSLPEISHPSTVAPRSPLENWLSALWGEILGGPAPGAHDDFFTLGGHSLHATQMVSRLRHMTGLEVSPRAIFEHPTIARLAAALDDLRSRGDRTPSAPRLERSFDASSPPLSFAQQRLWFLDQLVPGNPAYNLPMAFRLSGDVDVDALQRAVTSVVARHESLRTSFPSRGGQASQEIAPPTAVGVPVVDLRALRPCARGAEADRWVLRESRRGFDLSRGPLLRVALTRLAERDHLLTITTHHIVSDGWSQGVLCRDLAAFFRRQLESWESSSREPAPPRLPIQYADFAVWQRRWLSGEILHGQLAYWRRRLAGAPEKTRLPADRSRPDRQTYHGALRRSTLPAALAKSLRRAAERRGVSLYMLLATAVGAWLARASGQLDLVLGCPIANRNRREIEGLIGFFVNLLPLRVTLAPGESYRDLLGRLRQTALDTYAHQDLPFERLVDEIAPRRDLAYHPLVQITLALHNTPPTQLELPGIRTHARDFDSKVVRFDLELHFRDLDGHLHADAVYATDLFDTTTLERWMRQLQRCLESLASSPEERWSETPLLAAGERHQLLREWNDSARRWPAEAPVHALFELTAERAADQVAIVLDDHHLTYGELAVRSAGLARRLAEHGVGLGDRVAVAVERGSEMIASLLAVLSAGASLVPLDVDQPAARQAEMLVDSGARWVLAAAGWPVPRSPEVELLPFGPAPPPGADGPTGTFAIDLMAGAYLLYTSGSTGKPKGVTISHRALINRLLWGQEIYPLRPGDRVLQQASVAFDFAVWEVFAPLAFGATLVLPPPGEHRDVESLARRIRTQRVSVVHFVPSLLRALLDLDGLDLSSVRLVFSGGEELSSELARRLRQACNARAFNQYGPTEAAIDATYHPVEGSVAGPTLPIGTAISNLRAHCLDSRLDPVPIAAQGELFLAGRGLADGYHRRPRTTASRFLPDPFAPRERPGGRLYRTGDRARLLAGGEIEILGRSDRQVKIRGVRLELGEIESVLESHPAVREAAVVLASPATADGDEQLAAYLTTAPADPSAEQLASWRAERVEQWRTVHDDTYGLERSAPDPSFDVVGWNSSYTGQPIPEGEMREWVDGTVERIRALSPRKVLEIGCGTGLLLFRVAPHCPKYLGTDFSIVGLRELERHLGAQPELRHVTLERRAANDLSGVPRSAFDTVVISSVVQYFPSIDYLLEVLRGAAAVLEPMGSIFLGDVRNLLLQPAFCTSVELFQADPGLPSDELQDRVTARQEREEELLIDPALFELLRWRLPGLSEVRILPKTGRASNELTRFRYDVVLSFGPTAEATTETPGVERLSWRDGWEDREALGRAVERRRPRSFVLERIPDPRLGPARRAAAVLAERQAASVVELRRVLDAVQEPGLGPADLLAVAREHGYRLELDGRGLGTHGTFDALFAAESEPAGATWLRALEGTPQDRPLSDYANDPLRGRAHLKMLGDLREHLARRLPRALRPATFVVLDGLPRLPAGKIDRSRLARRALPATALGRTLERAGFVAPRTGVETAIAGIWSEILGFAGVGVHDDFFDLGGHSLLATQVVSRLRQTLGVDLPLRTIFERPTVALLAELVARTPRVAERSIPRAPRDRPLPLSFSQQRLWFLHQMDPSSPAYNMPEAHRLSGPLSALVLEAALAAILRRHEALRTLFPSAGGQPEQQVVDPPERCLPLVDLERLSPERRSAELAGVVDREAARPFDLARGPLVRAMLLRQAKSDHVLFLNLHHVVSDGWSQAILHSELAALYRAHVAGRNPSLPRLDLQYPDFACWQHESLSGDRFERRLGYWRERLRGAPTDLGLPVDRPRTAGAGSAGGSIPLTWPPSLTAPFEAHSRERGASLYMGLLAAFVVLLHRLTGRRQVAVGTPVANRDETRIEGLIGCFVNPLVMRLAVAETLTFDELLEQARQTAIEAFSHQEVPFERVVAALQPEREARTNPFFQTTLSLLGPRPGERWTRDLSRRPVELGFQAARLELEVFLWPPRPSSPEAGLEGKIVFQRQLFDATTVRRWSKYLETLLRAAAAEPSKPLHHLSLLDDGQRHQLLVEWNDTTAAPPPHELLHALVQAQAERTPDRVAVVFEDTALGYGELVARAERLARALLASGAARGEPIGIYLERSLETLPALLGVLVAGAAYVPLDLDDPADRSLEKLAAAGIRRLIAHPHLAPALAGAGVEVLPPSPVGGLDDAAAPPPRVAREDSAYMIYTSGSTGRPKLTAISHRAVCNRLWWMRRRFAMGGSDRVLHKTPLSFDVSVSELFTTLAAGATLVVAQPGEHREPLALARSLSRHRITHVHFVPSMLRSFLDSLRSERLGGFPRHVLTSGETLTAELVDAWSSCSDARLHNLYGPTETTIEVTHEVCGPGPSSPTIGGPIDNTRLRVADRFLRLVPLAAPGELLIAGRPLARGYRGRPRATARSFVPDPFSKRPGSRLYRSGDRARWTRDGRIRLSGRLDHQVKIRGVRVELGEIEATLAGHPALRAAVAVLLAGDDPSQARLMAFVVPHRTNGAPGSLPSGEELRDFLAESLPAVMIPASFEPADDLPLTGSGKIDRHGLGERARELGAARPSREPAAFVAPRGATEEALAGLWSELLDVERVGAHDDFFALGGHSLVATQVVSRIREQFSVELPVAALFEDPTVARLGQRLQGAAELVAEIDLEEGSL